MTWVHSSHTCKGMLVEIVQKPLVEILTGFQWYFKRVYWQHSKGGSGCSTYQNINFYLTRDESEVVCSCETMLVTVL